MVNAFVSEVVVETTSRRPALFARSPNALKRTQIGEFRLVQMYGESLYVREDLRLSDL